GGDGGANRGVGGAMAGAAAPVARMVRLMESIIVVLLDHRHRPCLPRAAGRPMEPGGGFSGMIRSTASLGAEGPSSGIRRARRDGRFRRDPDRSAGGNPAVQRVWASCRTSMKNPPPTKEAMSKLFRHRERFGMRFEFDRL